MPEKCPQVNAHGHDSTNIPHIIPPRPTPRPGAHEIGYTPGVSDSLHWLQRLRGRFVVFEGPDGSGKTTQFKRLAALVRRAGLPCVEVREPGGTPIGERVRDILLDHAHHDMSLVCEMLLYMASRAQLVEQVIRPAQQSGHLVLADRFVSSTIAYQGAAGGIPEPDIADAARIATAGLVPDLIIIFDVDAQTASRRLSPLLDRMEAKGADFHRRVRESYLEQARRQPNRHVIIDATGAEEVVWQRVLEALTTRWDDTAR